MRNIAYTVWSTGESRNCHLTTFVVVKRLIKTITLKECGLNKKNKKYNYKSFTTASKCANKNKYANCKE